MSSGDVQREVKMLKALEKIEGHLAMLVDLAQTGDPSGTNAESHDQE